MPDEVEFRVGPQGYSITIRGLFGYIARIIGGLIRWLVYLVNGAVGWLPPVRKRRRRESLRAGLEERQMWLVGMIGVTDEEESGPTVYDAGRYIQRALGKDAYDRYWSDAELDGRMDHLGRRVSRINELLDDEESWNIRKDWKP